MTIRAAVAALALLAAGCAPSPAEDVESAAPPPADVTPRHQVGWIAWESNRTGAYRIWIRPLAGGEPRQLSPDEPGRDHCCAHLSPDGERLVYLSLPGGSRTYLPPATDGALHLVGTDGRRDRVIARPARNYGEHRAAVWWSESELAYLAGDGSTRLLDLASGAERRLVEGEGDGGPGWLVDPTGAWATTGTPTFSARDPRTGTIQRATALGGCQPFFTADGELGFWAAGAGGPIDVLDPATRETRSILRKNDPRLPAGWRYLYFPMVSRDRTLLAYAASGGEHDHFAADYEVFVVEIDPATLEPVAAPQRVTRDRAVDRFPDVWRLAPPRAPAARRNARPLPAAEPGAPIFVWRSADDLNRPTPDAPSEELETRGAVYTDRRGRLAFAGGYAAAAEGRGAELDAALKATNQITLGVVVEPRSIAPGAGGPLVALAYSEKDRGFLLRQSGPRLDLVIRRSRADGRLGRPTWTIGELPDAGPHHVAFRFSPGRVAAFVDGRETFRAPAPDDFFHWRNRSLRLGAELGSDERFRGRLSQLVIWDRELDDVAIAAEAARALATVRDASQVETLEVEARLVARSTPPTLAEISPYRRALVVEEYRMNDGTSDGRRLRVARWALLDGERTPAMATPIGATLRLRLEPYDAQPQLESVVLADTLPPAPELPLHFESSLADG